VRSPRRLALTGALLVGLGLASWAVPTARAQTAVPAVETGWWSRQPLAQPVADDGFEVGWTLEREQSMAAVRLDLSAAGGGPVYLALDEAGGAGQDTGGIVVCATADAWEPANPGPYADRPEADCSKGPSVELGRDAGATEWLGDITSLAGGSTGTLSLVVRPIGKPLTEGVAATAPFSVQLATAELRVDDTSTGPAVAEPPTPPLDTGAGFDPGLSLPDVGTGLDGTGLPPVEVPAAPTTTAAPAPEEPVGLGAVAGAGTSRPWGRLVVLTPVSTGLGALAAAGRRWHLDRAIAQGLA